MESNAYSSGRLALTVGLLARGRSDGEGGEHSVGGKSKDACWERIVHWGMRGHGFWDPSPSVPGCPGGERGDDTS